MLHTRTFRLATLLTVSSLALPALAQTPLPGQQQPPPTTQPATTNTAGNWETSLKKVAVLLRTARERQSSGTREANTAYASAEQSFSRVLSLAGKNDLKNDTTLQPIARLNFADTLAEVTRLRQLVEQETDEQAATVQWQIITLYAKGVKSLFDGEVEGALRNPMTTSPATTTEPPPVAPPVEAPPSTTPPPTVSFASLYRPLFSSRAMYQNLSLAVPSRMSVWL